MKDIRIGYSALSGKVYAGKIRKDGITWYDGKVDVTNDFMEAVMRKFGGLETDIACTNGKTYLLTLKEVTPTETERKEDE